MTNELHWCPNFFVFLIHSFFLKSIVTCRLSMWREIMIPMYRLWLHGLYRLHRPWCPLSPKRPSRTHSFAINLPVIYMYLFLEIPCHHLTLMEAIQICYSSPSSLKQASLLWVICLWWMLFTHLPWKKWPPFRRRYFEMHFHEWKFLYFDKNFIQACS